MTESRSSASQNGQDFTLWVSTGWNPHLRWVERPLTERTREREAGMVNRQASLKIEEVSPQELWVAGELDRTTGDRFDEAVQTVIVGTGPLVLDLSGVRFLDSSGVRSLVKLGLSMRGRALVLREPSPPVMRVLQTTRLDEVGLWRIERATASA
jgi:anti-anti-sigma factor